MPSLSQPVNVAEALNSLTAHWSPKVVGRVNDQYIKVAKLKGELMWHAHDDEDETFMVIYGTLKIQLPDAEVVINAGEFFTVPRGVRHNPVAEEECGVMLIETVTTLHTGTEITSRSVPIDAQLLS
ncbi:cupin domain-containing protein [Pseudomonas sp.]|jgi:mannose-6-phosphate isomerase-like protein (cupin superfamily)|uniref:cupin domain-containing protein n=1 Tax=Pseudomonas sp. TaxID=306 RepID=UPI002631DD17|nr:cupin domain-containing protein [Pseudomonas sp.]